MQVVLNINTNHHYITPDELLTALQVACEDVIDLSFIADNTKIDLTI